MVGFDQCNFMRVEFGHIRLFPTTTSKNSIKTRASLAKCITKETRMKIVYELDKSCIKMSPLNDKNQVQTVQVTYGKVKLSRMFPFFVPGEYHANVNNLMIVSSDRRQLLILSLQHGKSIMYEYNCRITRLVSSCISQDFITELEGHQILLNGREHIDALDGVPIKCMACCSCATCFISNVDDFYAIGNNTCNLMGLEDSNIVRTQLRKDMYKIQLPFVNGDLTITNIKGGFYHTLFELSDGSVYG